MTINFGNHQKLFIKISCGTWCQTSALAVVVTYDYNMMSFLIIDEIPNKFIIL